MKRNRSFSCKFSDNELDKIFENVNFMKVMLDFNEVKIEKIFKKSVKGYQQITLRWFQFAIFMVFLLTWIINPLKSDNFSGQLLILNLINIFANLLVAIFLYINKNLQNPSICVFLLQIYSIIGFVESSYNSISTKFTATSFITATIFFQMILLIPMISRCSWKLSFISSFMLNLYLNFRFTNINDNWELRGLPALTHAFNFIFISFCSYYYEKYDRTLFYQRFKNEQSLRRFEEIIREVLPASILIHRGEEILFYNQETLRMLNVEDENLIEDKLRNIAITSLVNNENEVLNINSVNKEEQNEEYNGRKNIFGYYSKLVHCKQNKDFIRLTGTYFENDESHSILQEKINKKYFDIKMGKISWKGKEAVMAIVTEDFAAQRLQDLQEQAIYKDKLLATVSHDLRTPLNGVIGILDLALESDLNRSLRKGYGMF